GVPKEGENEMTSRISCLAYPNNHTKFSSVNITGAPQDGLSSQPQQTSPQPLLQHEGRQTNPNSYTPYSLALPLSKSDSINSIDKGAKMINSWGGLSINYS
ncbi:MAG: hypothetical protein ACR2IS_15245, partial [Nitrososphaeraceae archaeon]